MKGSLLFLLFPLSQILLLSGFYQTFGVLPGGAYAGTLLGIMADAVLLFILVHNTKKEKMERELEELIYFQKTEELQRNRMEERQKALYAMKLSFGQQLQDICDKLEAGNKQNVTQDIVQIQESLERTKPEIYTQNPIVNALISEKQNLCREQGFSMDIHLQLPKNLGIAPLHLCSIFSNLLDNAMEAVEELQQEDRRIQVNGGVKGKYLIVKVSNTTIRTHAERKKRHGRGMGTEILEEIAKNYEGEYSARYENGQYFATIVLKEKLSGRD